MDRVIAASHSDFFAKACDGGFKVLLTTIIVSSTLNDLQESLLQEVTLDNDPEIIEIMVRYFYELDYDDGRSSKELNQTADEEDPPAYPLKTNARVWRAADFYGVNGLKKLAVSKTTEILWGYFWWW